jgi:hypothetical protein
MFLFGFVVGAASTVCAIGVWAAVKLAHDVAEHERNQP